MIRTVCLLALLLLLCACQRSATVREDASASYRQLQGAVLELRQGLTVPAGRARVFVQDGKVGESTGYNGSFDQYRPHCGFEIDSIDHAGFTIVPGEYPVSLVQHSLVPVVRTEGVQLAAMSLAMGIIGPGTTSAHEGYHFWLVSEQHPEVRRLSCYGAFAELPDLQAVTFDELQQVLGDIARFRL